MTITHVGSGSGAFVGYTGQAGDLILLEQNYVNSALIPNEAPGYTTLASGLQGTMGYRLSYKYLAGGETNYGGGATQTSALGWSVFRSTTGVLNIGAVATNKGTGTVATLSALTLQDADGSSWVWGGVMTRTSTAAQMGGAVTGMSLRNNQIRVACHDTAAGVTSFAARTKSGMASEAWAAFSVEIKEGLPPPPAREISATQTVPAPSQTGSIEVISPNDGLPRNISADQIVPAPSQTSSIDVVGAPRNISAAQTVPRPSQFGWVQSVPFVPPAGRILLGKLPSGAYGMRISRAGYDVNANPVDDEQLIFSSEWPEMMPIYLIGSTTHRTTAQQGQKVIQTIPYASLGFIPFVEFIVKGNGDALPAGTDTFQVGHYYSRTSFGAYLNLRCNITSSAIRIESVVPNGPNNNSNGYPRTWTIYWCIYRKRAF